VTLVISFNVLNVLVIVLMNSSLFFIELYEQMAFEENKLITALKT
jgi:hypothetical protein